MVFCGQNITLSRLTLANFVFVHSLFFGVGARHIIIVCACVFRDGRVRPRDSAITVQCIVLLISQVKLAVYQFSYFLERSLLVTVIVPRKIVLHLLLLLSKQGNSCLTPIVHVSV